MLARGYSLTELIIALSAGVILITACASLGGQFIGKSVSLDRQLIITEESLLLQRRIQLQLRRAGFQASVPADNPVRTAQPFRTAWFISENLASQPNSCVLFAYDKNRNGVLDVAIPNERFGFRWHNGAIEMREAGRTCEQKGWQDLTSPDIRVTGFSLDYDTHSPALIHISITLQHRSDPAITAARHFTVVMPNYTSGHHA